VGAGVLGSAIGMDKAAAKRLLKEAGLPIAKFLSFRKGDALSFEKAKKYLGLPMFVKPANSGSSVGISKVKNAAQFKVAVSEAFKYDSKILIEQFVPGREIEISVLGNEKPKASLPGEVIPKHEFYSYAAKYLDENGAVLVVPVRLSKQKVQEIQKLAVQVFKSLELEGMARVDFFLTKSGKFFVNEVNTIPGFTKISMYPKLWAVSGLPYTKLLDKLIELAILRHQKETKLRTNF
jgi:D-alanine-D-alanine ligase